MNKIISLEQAVEKVTDGMTIMFGGFLGNGSPAQITDALVAKGVKDLTIIANDTAFDTIAHGKLVANHQVKRAIVSHTGTNKETAIQKILWITYHKVRLRSVFAPRVQVWVVCLRLRVSAPLWQTARTL